MPEHNENQTIVAVAQDAVEPVKVADGLYLIRDHGGVRKLDVRADLEEYGERPRRKAGSYTVTDVPSFVQALAKHGLPQTELWAHDSTSKISAVVNADLGTTGDGVEDYAGWRDHSISLQLLKTPDWTEWTNADGKLQNQLAFAEFIEDHLPNFVDPSGADMLELAQTFQATTKVDFASSQRVKSGETQLNYVENQTASAGKKGQLAIPDTFTVALQPFERGETYRVQARFRYRIADGNLLLGYRLTRPKDVLRDAFDQVAAKVGEETGRQVWSTT